VYRLFALLFLLWWIFIGATPTPTGFACLCFFFCGFLPNDFFFPQLQTQFLPTQKPFPIPKSIRPSMFLRHSVSSPFFFCCPVPLATPFFFSFFFALSPVVVFFFFFFVRAERVCGLLIHNPQDCHHPPPSFPFFLLSL